MASSPSSPTAKCCGLLFKVFLIFQGLIVSFWVVNEYADISLQSLSLSNKMRPSGEKQNQRNGDS